MHVHQSLFRGDQNAFYDPEDEYHISAAGRRFIAGLLRHAPEITLVTNQWVNSYKRLVPGYEAPVYISWAHLHRPSLVRVPAFKPGYESSVRVEYRAPDPACNPYLAFSVMLAAGIKGIADEYPLAQPTDGDVFSMTREERMARGVKTLPSSLGGSLALAEESELLPEALGEHVFTSFIENKTREWEKYRQHVTDYEVSHYLPRPLTPARWHGHSCPWPWHPNFATIPSPYQGEGWGGGGLPDYIVIRSRRLGAAPAFPPGHRLADVPLGVRRLAGRFPVVNLHLADGPGGGNRQPFQAGIADADGDEGVVHGVLDPVLAQVDAFGDDGDALLKVGVGQVQVLHCQVGNQVPTGAAPAILPAVASTPRPSVGPGPFAQQTPQRNR